MATTLKAEDVSKIRMSVCPPKEVGDADNCVIHCGTVKQWVGIGWVNVRPATKEDYEKIPTVV